MIFKQVAVCAKQASGHRADVPIASDAENADLQPSTVSTAQVSLGDERVIRT